MIRNVRLAFSKNGKLRSVIILFVIPITFHSFPCIHVFKVCVLQCLYLLRLPLEFQILNLSVPLHFADRYYFAKFKNVVHCILSIGNTMNNIVLYQLKKIRMPEDQLQFIHFFKCHKLA